MPDLLQLEDGPCAGQPVRAFPGRGGVCPMHIAVTPPLDDLLAPPTLWHTYRRVGRPASRRYRWVPA